MRYSVLPLWLIICEIFTSDGVRYLCIRSCIQVHSLKPVDDAKVAVLRDPEGIASCKPWCMIVNVTDVNSQDGSTEMIAFSSIHDQRVRALCLTVQRASYSYDARIRIYSECLTR